MKKDLGRARPERWSLGFFYDPSLGPASEQLIRLQDFLGIPIVGTLPAIEKYKVSIAPINSNV